MKTRRSFLQDTLWLSAILSCGSLTGCTSRISQNIGPKSAKDLHLSLAQWSLHKAFKTNELDPKDFAAIAKKDYDISAVEYVNQFYVDHANDVNFWISMKDRADSAGVKSLLIMVDAEGDLGNPNDKERHKAVQKHLKWIYAAKILGCHSIRVNAFGDGSSELVQNAMIDGMGQLADHAAKENVNVLIENHGLFSSDGQWITTLMKAVDKPNFGTLPDFGNWCLNAKWGSTEGNKCTDAYDRYQGLIDFLPYAKGVSAKTYQFDSDGNETLMDYKRLLKIVKDHGYQGHIGIEYEGSDMSEPDGIRATKQLIERTWAVL